MAIVDIFLYMWNLFTLWIDTLFVVPIKNTDMLWILVPLWLSWFFGEFFQEKIGTSFGNAISNAVVVLWAGIDCIRQTTRFITEGILSLTGDIFIRFLLCGLLIAYGILIIIFGTKVKEKVKIFGRIRDVTYAFAIFVPVLYGVVPFTTELVLSALVFFPLFYYAIELIDTKTPTPKAMKADIGSSEQNKNIIIKAKVDNGAVNVQAPATNYYYSVTNNKKPPSSGSVNYWSNEEN